MNAENDFVEGDATSFSVLVESTQNLTLLTAILLICLSATSAENWTTHLLTNKQQALGSYQAFIKLIGHRNPAL